MNTIKYLFIGILTTFVLLNPSLSSAENDFIIKSFIKAAEEGDEWALVRVGGQYVHRKNYKEALVWYRKALEAKNPQVKKTAEKGIYQCERQLSKKFENNTSSETNKNIKGSYDFRISYIKAAMKRAAAGDEQALIDVGYGYERLYPNYKEALVWYRKALKAKDPRVKRKAENLIHNCEYQLSKQTEDSKSSKPLSPSSNSKKAEEPNEWDMLKTARSYHLKRNYKEAAVWYRKALEAKDPNIKEKAEQYLKIYQELGYIEDSSSSR